MAYHSSDGSAKAGRGVTTPLLVPMLLSLATTTTLLAASARAGPEGPCDIFAKGTPPTPCVAAHSMTRALFASYAGPLYSVKNAAGAVKDIPTKGGVADAAAQDAFCGTPNSCVVHAIYDQSPMKNHLGIEHGAPNLGPPRNRQDTGVNFTDPKSKTTLGGAPVYSAFFVGDNSKSHSYTGQGYSNRTAKGTAVGDEPQTTYAVFSGRHYNSGCCFDYGNAENVTAAGNAGPMSDGTMEAVYFGSGYAPHGKGSGSGPWIGADMENGIYEGASNQASVPSLKPSDFVVGFVKGRPGNYYEIKTGNPQEGAALHAQYAGPRPKGYELMKKQGAIILGIEGDNSPWCAAALFT